MLKIRSVTTLLALIALSTPYVCSADGGVLGGGVTETGGGVLVGGDTDATGMLGGGATERANPSLYNCLDDTAIANDCNANTIYNLRVFQPNNVDEVTGYYDEDGKKCTNIAASNCIFHLTASFQPHCADVGGVTTVSCKKADSIVVNWTVQQFKEQQGMMPLRSIATGSSTELPSVTMNVADIMSSAGLQPNYSTAICNLEQTQLQTSGGISTSCGAKDTVLKLANLGHNTDECGSAGGQVVEVTNATLGTYNSVTITEAAGTMTVNGTEVTNANFGTYNNHYYCIIAGVSCPLGPGSLWTDSNIGKSGGAYKFCY